MNEEPLCPHVMSNIEWGGFVNTGMTSEKELSHMRASLIHPT